jgi:PST family polysaccharide transporter
MSDKIAKNVLYRLTEAIATSTILILQTSLLAQNLTKEQFGLYSLGVLWSLLFLIVSFSFSLPNILARELCQQKNTTQTISNVFALQASCGALLLIFTVLLVSSLSAFSGIRGAGYYAYISVGMLLAAPITMQGILVSEEKMKEVFVVRTLAFLINYLILFAIVKQNVNLQLIFLSHSVLPVVFAVGFFKLSEAQKFIDRSKINKAQIKEILIQSFPVMLTGLLTQFYNRVDVLILDSMRGPTEVASYTAAYKILDYLLIISSSIVAAIFPIIMRLSANPTALRRFYLKSSAALVALLLLLSTLVSLHSVYILKLLYSDAYTLGESTLRVLMLSVSFTALSSLSAVVLLAYKKQALYLRALFVCLILNIVLNYLLIPRYGHLGAAIATTATEAILLCFCATMSIKISSRSVAKD